MKALAKQIAETIRTGRVSPAGFTLCQTCAGTGQAAASNPHTAMAVMMKEPCRQCFGTGHIQVKP